MQDDEITLCNTCTDLVSLRKTEAFPLYLLKNKGPGEWVSVQNACIQIGVAVGDLKPELFVTWLPDPMALDAYAVIVFYDDESKWSMAAHYHRARLLGAGPSSQAFQPTGVVISAASRSASEQVTPAGGV